MKIPDTVRIAGVDYSVDFVPTLNDGVKLLYGQVDFEQTCIHLNPDAAGYQHQCITLWHEILHALIGNSRIKMDADKEEELVESLSRGIYMVLQDNGAAFFDLAKSREPTPAT